jgi:ATP-dependent DNA helicase RecG
MNSGKMQLNTLLSALKMDIKKVQSIIKEGESNKVEFKTTTTQIKSIFETICAFLNGDGGTVLIGIKNNGQIIGQKATDNTQQEIARELNKIEPHAEIDISYIPLENNQQIIAITVKSGTRIPYVYDGRPFLRNQSTTIRMPRDKYEHLLYEKRPIFIRWESLTTNDCNISDLDNNRIQQVIRVSVNEGRLMESAMSAEPKEILKKFDLMSGDYLTNAAVILFCKNRTKQFLQSELKLARFKGINKSEFLDNKSMRGNIFDLYEYAMSYLENYLPLEGKIEAGNPFRIETPAIPYKVLREAIVNALAHRDYSSSGGSVSIAIYDDRVEVSSTGRLPNEISLSELGKQHESHPRNRLIANVLYACRMIERWGRGTQDMIEICKKSGNPRPKFVELTGSFTVIFPLKEPIGDHVKQKKIVLTSRQKEILEIIEEFPKNSAQIADKLKKSPSLRMVQIDLLKLEKAGFVKREGKARSVIWKILKPE